MTIYGPAWLEVDLDVIRFNIKSCKTYVKTKLLAVVKADGYGHGAVEVARVMAEEGVDYFGVATIFEALELRKHHIKTPILVFSITPSPFIKEAILNNITLTVSSLEMARAIEAKGKQYKVLPKVHVKLNTGMNRLGFSCNDINGIESVSKMMLDVEGMFTHFAKADSPDVTVTDNQAIKFNDVTKQLNKRGVSFEIKHIANSAAMMRSSAYDLDMVRAGGILYGHFCLKHFIDKPPFKVKRAMSIRAVLSHINELEAGEGVSYGWLYNTDKPTRVGVIPIGYTDGISRRNTNQTSFLLGGKRVNQIGLICMDQMMIDVTKVSCQPGDVVTLLGKDQDEISLDERAGDAQIGKAELFAGIGRRLPKVYFVDGIYKKTLNYLLQ